jgi:hypothetical protein
MSEGPRIVVTSGWVAPNCMEKLFGEMELFHLWISFVPTPSREGLNAVGAVSSVISTVED